MSDYHEQALIEAPVERVWPLVGDPERFTEWWPDLIEVDGEPLYEGSEFVQVSRGPFRMRSKTTFQVDHMEELKEVRMHCTVSGMFIHWQLTPAQGGTFVEARSGVDPIGAPGRILELTRRKWVRRWLVAAVGSLRSSAAAARASGPTR